MKFEYKVFLYIYYTFLGQGIRTFRKHINTPHFSHIILQNVFRSLWCLWHAALRVSTYQWNDAFMENLWGHTAVQRDTTRITMHREELRLLWLRRRETRLAAVAAGSWFHFPDCIFISNALFCICHITHTPREQAQSVTLGDNHHNTLRHGYVVVLVFPLTWTRQCGDIIIISSVYPCRRHSSFIHSFPSAHTKSIMKFCLCAFCEIEIRIFTTSSRDIAKNRRDVAKP